MSMNLHGRAFDKYEYLPDLTAYYDIAKHYPSYIVEWTFEEKRLKKLLLKSQSYANGSMKQNVFPNE